MVRNFSIFFFAFLLSNLAAAGLPEWFACEIDADCILVDGPCDRIAINKKYLEHQKMMNRELKGKGECILPKKILRKDLRSLCRSYKCEAETKE